VTKPRQKRREKLGELSRQFIIDATVRLISRDGYQRTTMDHVAAEAGMAKGTIYLHFKTKNDLIHAVIMSSMEPLAVELNAVLDGSGPPAERLQALLLGHLRYFDQHRDLFRVLLCDRDMAQNRQRRCRSTRYRAIVERVASVIDEGIHRGTFAECDSVKAATMLLEANIALIHSRLTADAPGPVEEDARLVSQIFLHGLLRTRKRGS